MADTADTVQNIIFSWNAKTLIGEKREYEEVPQGFEKENKKKDDYYYIAYPCVVQFEVKTPKTGTASLNWTLVPLFYKALNQGKAQIIFEFPKSEVALSNIVGGDINSKLKSAWEEICK